MKLFLYLLAILTGLSLGAPPASAGEASRVECPSVVAASAPATDRRAVPMRGVTAAASAPAGLDRAIPHYTAPVPRVPVEPAIGERCRR